MVANCQGLRLQLRLWLIRLINFTPQTEEVPWRLRFRSNTSQARLKECSILSLLSQHSVLSPGFASVARELIIYIPPRVPPP